MCFNKINIIWYIILVLEVITADTRIDAFDTIQTSGQVFKIEFVNNTTLYRRFTNMRQILAQTPNGRTMTDSRYHKTN